MNAVSGRTDDRPLQFFPVAIGNYRHHDPLDTETEVAGIAELLTPFGAETHDWKVKEGDRGSDAVEDRLREWSEPQNAGDTVLYWVGHGESDGQSALLAHARSPRPLTAGGMTPEQLVRYLASRQAHRNGAGGWAIVVIDACKSARFVQLMNAYASLDPTGPRNFLLVATSEEGVANLGTFRKALSTVLTVTFRAEDTIDLWTLAGELTRNLHDCPVIPHIVTGRALLHRKVPVLTHTSLDQLAEIEAVLDELSDDERRHFVPKASGAELGEQAWYFEGRTEERHQILTWLDTARSGLLVITGAAGSGKSALLGHVLVHTQPELQRVLEGAGHLTPLPAGSPQPRNPFDSVIHLTGATPQDLVARIAQAAGLNAPPANQSLTAQSDWLITAMRGRQQPFTLLVDALDEAHLPLVTADQILRRLAALPLTRVIVGTRRSPYEGPDLSHPNDQYLLDALGAAEDRATVISIGRDSDAMARYVRRRLTAAVHNGILQAEQQQIDHAADAIGTLDREFLYARLSVHEIIQTPGLDSLETLLDSDHRQLFARAVDRLASLAPANRPLLEALGLTQGHGLPLHDGIWATVATALNDEATGITISDADIEALTKTAAPYLMLDTESGQSVYRLAHRTFAEHFTQPSAYDHRHHLITARLAAHADAHLSSSPPNAYLVQHLAAHAALGGPSAWEELARHIRVLDHLDPSAVAAEVLRTAYGRADLPLPVAATLSAHNLLAQAFPEDRSAVRSLVTARLTGELPPRIPPTPWAVRWTHLPATHLHITLSGHTGTVRALVAVPLADGRTVLASASADRMVRLWDPTTGRQVGEAFAAHSNEVHALAAVPLADGRTLLATIGRDQVVRLWDPTVPGRLVGELLTGDAGAVHALAVVPLSNGRTLLATVGDDRMVRQWDPTTRCQVGEAFAAHSNAVRALVAVPLADGRTLLASASADRMVRLWDPTTGRQVGEAFAAHSNEVHALAAVPLADGGALLATVGNGRSTGLWDPTTGGPVGRKFSGRHAVAAVPLADGRVLLATGSTGSTGNMVRLWDATNGRSAGQSLSGHTAPVHAATAVPLADGRVLLATGSADNTVRLWAPITGRVTSKPRTAHTKALQAVTPVSVPDRPTFLAAVSRDDRTVHLWDAQSGCALNDLPTGHTEAVLALATVPLPDGRTLLATASIDRTVRLWDAVNGRSAGQPLSGHTAPVRAVTAVPWPDGRTLLATAGDDGTMLLWHPETSQPIGHPLTGHKGAVQAMTAIHMPNGRTFLATAGADRTVCLWDAVKGSLLHRLAGHTGAVQAVTAVPWPNRPTLLAIAGHDGTVRLWNPYTGRPVGNPLTGHTGAVRGMAAVRLSDGSTILATASDDRTVRLWHPATGALLRTLPLGVAVTTLTAFDGRMLCVGSESGLLAIELDTVGSPTPRPVPTRFAAS